MQVKAGHEATACPEQAIDIEKRSCLPVMPGPFTRTKYSKFCSYKKMRRYLSLRHSIENSGSVCSKIRVPNISNQHAKALVFRRSNESILNQVTIP